MTQISNGDMPTWSDDPVQRLRHTLYFYRTRIDSYRIITATLNYPKSGAADWTGLTIGDLRAILNILESTGITEQQ